MEIIVYGSIQSVALLLMAFGFSLVYGISRLPNFAHGAIYVLTGFVAWFLVHRAGLPYWATVPLSMSVAALVGVAIYQLVLRRVRGLEVSEVIDHPKVREAYLGLEEGTAWRV